VSEKFHARYDVKSKRYLYRILNRHLPAAIFRQYAWHIPKQLHMDAMAASLPYITGTHDFTSFEGAGSPRTSSIRSVMHADLEKTGDGYLVFKIQGDGFLRFMVRNIVGTLVDVGLGKITPREFNRILEDRDRNLAGITAPAHGLFLMQVNY
jgi:tRNA pseudouridine38-40 synthase